MEQIHRANLLALLEAYVESVERGSFSQAAARLGKTPSAVNKAVTQLEQSLGVKLLERSTRLLATTEAGEAYLRVARQTLATLAEAHQSLLELDGRPQGRLRLSAAHAFMRPFLARACALMAQRHPQVVLDVRLTDGYSDLLADGYDLALRLGSLEHPGLVARALLPHRVRLYAGDGYLQRHGTPRQASELRGHRALHYRHAALDETWRLQGEADGVRLEAAMTSDNFDLLLEMAQAGAGILPCPDWVFPQPPAAQGLQILLGGRPLDAGAFGDAIHAVYPAYRRGSPKLQAMLACLGDACAALT